MKKEPSQKAQDAEQELLERITQEFRDGKAIQSWEVKMLLLHHFPDEYAALTPYEKGRISRSWVHVFQVDDSWMVFGLNFYKDRPGGQLVLKLVRHIFGDQEFVVK